MSQRNDGDRIPKDSIDLGGDVFMEITLRLSDEIIQKLHQLPNPDQFVGEILQCALRDTSSQKALSPSPLSKWARLVKRIDENPGDLKGYSARLRQDMREFRDNVAFIQDIQYGLSS